MKRFCVSGLLGLVVACGGAEAHETKTPLATTDDTQPAPPSDDDIGGPDIAPEPPRTFALGQSCTKTVCQTKTDAAKDVCDQCRAAAGENATSKCASFCDLGSVCTADDAVTCAESSFAVEVTAKSDAALLAACKARQTKYWSCAGTAPTAAEQALEGLECIAESRSMTPAMTTYLACETASCAPDCALPPVSTLGDDLCAGIAARCDRAQAWFTCGVAPSMQSEHDVYIGPFLNPDAIAVALECLDNACDDIHRCYDAWAASVLGVVD